MEAHSQSLFSQSQQPAVEIRLPQKGRRQIIPVNQSRITNFFPTTSQTNPGSEALSPNYDVILSSNEDQPLTILDPNGNEVTLHPVNEIPETYRSVFSFPYFNIVQSRVFDTALHTDNPVVLCAPTGSGKTVLFEMAIIRLLMNCETSQTSLDSIKVIYMAPVKALCSERFQDWKGKFERYGMTCKELTGDTDADDFYSMKQASLILTTPEKWDSMTRRWKDNKSFITQIRLFMIDEMHLLNDETRGATVEAVVSRMKLVITQLHHNEAAYLRIIAVSATMANFEDIAEWLGPRYQPAVSFMMNEKYRPVELTRHVYGYNFYQGSNEFKFDMSLNYKLPEIIRRHSNNRPTLVFVSTRKGTQQSATMISREVSLPISGQARQSLQAAASSVRDTVLKECLVKGIGFHNAGLDYTERKIVEELFLNGHLMVLVSTSTLAMGVNLPAHLVIIKSTQHYTSNGFEEYTESEILQMIGRAGRPQFDTSATAVIMTKLSQQDKYKRLIGGKQVIESSLHKNLIEHLNAEIVLGTIPKISVALHWLKATFLYVRIMKNPTYYGLKGHQTRDSIEAYLQQLCVRKLELLEGISMIHSDNNSDRNIVSTESGKLMARYCISFDTMSKVSQLTGEESQERLINFLGDCQEFSDIQLRVSEKKVLNEMNKNKSGVNIRYPMKGKIKTSAMKVCCLIQIELGCLPLSDFSLNQDTSKVFRTASRITKCLVELYMSSEKANCLYNAVLLNKCISSHLWENSGYVTKQLPGVGIKTATCFTNAGVHSFSKLLDLNPRDIELICNRHPPFGNGINDLIKHLPKYEMAIDQQLDKLAPRDAVITVALRLANAEDITKKSVTKHHSVILLIYDADNRVSVNVRLYDSTLVKAGVWTKTTSVRRAIKGDELSVCLLSLSWVGLDICSNFTPKYTGRTYEEYRKELQLQEQRAQTLTVPQQVPTSTPGLCNSSKKTEVNAAVSTCGHKCLVKATCGHLCCKDKSLQETISNRTKYKATKQAVYDHTPRLSEISVNTSHTNRKTQQLMPVPTPVPIPGRGAQRSSNVPQNYQLSQQWSLSQSLPEHVACSQSIRQRAESETISSKLSKFRRAVPPQCPSSMRRVDTSNRHYNPNDCTFGDFSIMGDDFQLNDVENESRSLQKQTEHHAFVSKNRTEVQKSINWSPISNSVTMFPKKNPSAASNLLKSTSCPLSYTLNPGSQGPSHYKYSANNNGSNMNYATSAGQGISPITTTHRFDQGFKHSIASCEYKNAVTTSEYDSILPPNQGEECEPNWDEWETSIMGSSRKETSSKANPANDKKMEADTECKDDEDSISYSPLANSQLLPVSQGNGFRLPCSIEEGTSNTRAIDDANSIESFDPILKQSGTSPDESNTAENTAVGDSWTQKELHPRGTTGDLNTFTMPCMLQTKEMQWNTGRKPSVSHTKIGDMSLNNDANQLNRVHGQDLLRRVENSAAELNLSRKRNMNELKTSESRNIAVQRQNCSSFPTRFPLHAFSTNETVGGLSSHQQPIKHSIGDKEDFNANINSNEVISQRGNQTAQEPRDFTFRNGELESKNKDDRNVENMNPAKILIGRLGNSYSQTSCVTNDQSNLAPSTIKHTNAQISTSASESFSPSDTMNTSVDKKVRQANLQTDVMNNSLATKRESLFGQTLKTDFRRNRTATVRPIIQNLKDDIPKANVPDNSRLSSQHLVTCEGESAFEGLELLIQLKRRKKM